MQRLTDDQLANEGFRFFDDVQRPEHGQYVLIVFEPVDGSQILACSTYVDDDKDDVATIGGVDVKGKPVAWKPFTLVALISSLRLLHHESEAAE